MPEQKTEECYNPSVAVVAAGAEARAEAETETELGFGQVTTAVHHYHLLPLVRCYNVARDPPHDDSTTMALYSKRDQSCGSTSDLHVVNRSLPQHHSFPNTA